jgi:hypothetical protein
VILLILTSLTNCMNTNAYSHGVNNTHQRWDGYKISNQNEARKQDAMHTMSFVKKHRTVPKLADMVHVLRHACDSLRTRTLDLA